MKKNISINISGIIFHIEEDGYENLQRYLDSINNYFSSYEESEEIIADIESRIAEIFLEKLTDGKQVVSAEDVSALIATMGNTTDFEAIEEEDDFAQSSSTQSSTESTSGTSGAADTGGQYQRSRSNTGQNTSKGLFRDLNNQILGGVCSGLAHYMKIDSIWVRVIFLLLLPTGFSLIAYFILWVAVPGSNDLKELDFVKKLYRDPNDRVLGGVCSGLAKYLNIDVIILRIIFIVLLFGGIGFIAYLVLWVITPEASSITDRMQMQGEKVTLSNIDENIKKQKTEEDFGPKNEGAFTKVILFPFRLIGKVLSGISQALAPLMLFIVAVIRVFTGVIISIVGLANMFALIVVAGVVFGLYNGDEWYYIDGDLSYIPYELLNDTIPLAGLIALIIVLFIPFLYLFIAGITIVAKRKVMSSAFGWSALGFWLIALLISAATVPNVVRDFRDESSINTTENIEVSGDVIVLDIDNRYGYHRNNDFFLIDMDIRSTSDAQVRLDSRIRSRGRNRVRAEENAENVVYDYSVRDSVITFDNMFTLKRNAEYRAQELELTLYIPEGQKFKVDRGMEDLLGRFGRGYRWSTAYRNTWVYTENGLECLTCETRRNDGGSASTSSSDGFRKTIDLDNVTQLNLKDAFKVTVEQGDEEQVVIESNNRRVRDVRALVSSDELEITGLGMNNRQTREIDVHIVVSKLDKIIARDEVDLELRGFDTDEIEIVVRNDARVEIDGQFASMDASLINNGRLTLLGEVSELLAELRDESRLSATESEIKSATLDTHSDTFVRIKVKDYLRVDARGRSVVRYEGDPELDIVHTSTSASVGAY